MSVEILSGGLITVLAAVGVAVGAALLVHRFVPLANRQENNDVAGVAFAIIGVLYAILLTFVTISVWETNDHAEDSSRREARAVVDLDRYADTLDPPDRTRLHELTGRYAEIVIRDEWPRMARGEPAGRDGAAALAEMWHVVDGTPPATESRAARQAEARVDLRALANSRDARLAAVNAGLPSVMWLALLVGAALALGNALMFGVKGSGEYVAIIAMLAAMSALMLFAVYQLEYPYRRGESVTADVFASVIGDLGTS